MGCDAGNSTAEQEQDQAVRRLYVYCVPPLVVFCAVSVAVNARVLLAVCWLRRPVSPTLALSLSLAAADACASLLFGLQLVLHSLLPHAFRIQVTEHRSCLWLMLEMTRLSTIIVGVLHLLALAGNHYLGIRRPLRYALVATRGNTASCLLLLWLLPAAFFGAYFSAVPGQGFQSEYCSDYSFLLRQKFRAVFSLLFFAPLAAMLLIYSHVFAIVRRQQSRRALLGRADARPPAGSLKAVRTTLLILGSFAVGWMPAVAVHALCCEDCVLTFRDVSLPRLVLVSVAVNLLVICKTLLNPVIYAARMKDVQTALHLMNASLRLRCCPFLERRSGDVCGACETSRHGLQHRKSTVVCRANTLSHHARRHNSDPTEAHRVFARDEGHQFPRSNITDV
ncbi:lysophosphatidic acid receptor 1-like [Bacillus rossius redtenbacheri]|uniref:lysophosphatidic acid receptor 1-like n=1 Tax=Bacillus rossius redtenbacheri TaxID=93214 RepID=UPI002FDD9709